MAKNSGKFFMAGLLGALAGAVGGLLLAPKSGKETREDIAKLALQISKKVKTEASETKLRVKDVYGKATEEAVRKYNEIKSAIVSKIATVKNAGMEIDKEKYGKVVDEVVADFKGDIEGAKGSVTKITSYFKKDWDKMKKALS